jgi:adenosylcobinamide kinase/adenosylcobinamide-phosphate guanylyltransferase
MERIGKLTFIIGGARSGKSAYAERIAAQSGEAVLYIATARALDEEMRSRIAAHRRNRPGAWKTLELPGEVGRYLLAHPPQEALIVLDCLTLLVSNLVLEAARDIDQPDAAAAGALVEAEIAALLKSIQASSARWLVVSNEVGQGLVPPYPVGRVFRDLLGWANQRLADKADEVIWMVAGIPVPIGDYRNDG